MKQAPSESIENYAKSLNNLAAECKYTDCCRDRMIRDIFVAGIRDNTVLSALLQDCESKKFDEVVEKAKLIEQVRLDAQDIRLDPRTRAVDKVKKAVKLSPNYVCIRCNAQGKHLAHECFALKLTCRSCKKVGHTSRACKSKVNKAVHIVQDQHSSASNDPGESAESSC